MSDRTPDIGFESYLRAALADAVAGPVPTTFPARAKRRVRMRQSMFSVVVAAVVVAIATIGGSALGVFETDRYIEVAGEELNERGAGGQYPCNAKEWFGPTDEGPVGCVAVGAYDGISWALGVTWKGNGDLCIVNSTVGGGFAGGSGMSCGAYDPRGIGMDLIGFGSEPAEQMLAMGYVPGNTTELFLERGGDPPMELQLYPTPRELAAGFISLDAKFYLVWLPDDAETLVAYDGDREIARLPIDGDSSQGDAPNDAPPPGATVDVTRFRAGGIPYVMDVYGEELNGDDVGCTRIESLRPRVEKKGGPCHPGFPQDNAVSVAATVLKPPLVAVHGMVRSEVAALWAETPGRRRFEVEIIPTPRGVERGISFFVFVVADAYAIDKPLTVIAEDAQGNVIQERTILLANDVSG
ncbi:MAG: hypothetical protein ACRDKT_10955 [Actinomycetota bacterium]